MPAFSIEAPTGSTTTEITAANVVPMLPEQVAAERAFDQFWAIIEKNPRLLNEPGKKLFAQYSQVHVELAVLLLNGTLTTVTDPSWYTTLTPAPLRRHAYIQKPQLPIQPLPTTAFQELVGRLSTEWTKESINMFCLLDIDERLKLIEERIDEWRLATPDNLATVTLLSLTPQDLVKVQRFLHADSWRQAPVRRAA